VRTRLSKKGVAAMDRKDAIAWVRSVCTDQLRASQAKTLSVLVILVMAIAYLLLTAMGLLARTHYRPSVWPSNNRPDSLSALRIGQHMLDQIQATIPA
jgi:hypothetical protein